jgi:hypothetical protein
MGSRAISQFCVFSILLAVFGVPAPAVPAPQKVQLFPKNIPGQVSRYEVQSRTVTTGETTTPIVNPEGGSKFTESVHLLIAVKSLEPKLLTDGSRLNRFVATFEQAARDSDSDALDLSAASAGDPFAALAGHSVQYALDAEGQLRDVEGLEEVFRDKAAARPVLDWLPQLSAKSRLPENPVSIGAKWKTEHPVTGMPFDDIVWHSESTYLRNESCKLYSAPDAQTQGDGSAEAGGGGQGTHALAGDCAVVLTRFQVSRRGSPNSDATPPDYVHNSLRTSGKWSGSGESLDSIALDGGLLVSSSQTSTQDIDFKIKAATTGSSIHRQAHSETHTEITLLP